MPFLNSISGTLGVLGTRKGISQIVTNSLILNLDASNQLSFGNRNFVSAKIYSVYNGGLRSSNYTVQYSDDGSTWTTAWTGVATNNSSCGLVQNTGSGNGSYGSRRYWRYIEGSAVVSHHPRVSRIILTDQDGSDFDIVNYTSDNCSDSGTYIVGTVTYDSYQGWKDLSSTSTNARLLNGVTYNSSNQGYLAFDNVNDYATVPSSSKFAFGTGDFTLETWIRPQSFSTYLHMIALPDQNTFALKANVSDGQIYFYSPSYTTYGSTSGWTLTLNTWNHVVFKRESSVGYAFLNGVSKGSKSGFASSFSTQTLNIHNGYGSEFASCGISSVRIYNRALNSNEITQNFNATRSKYAI
jgi:hypothetical protein